MSYASAVKDHGPKQSDSDVSRDPPPFPFTAQATQEEDQKIADSVPEIAHSDSGVHSIDSLSSDTVNVPSFADQQKEAEETAEQVKKDASKAGDQLFDDAKDFGKKAEKEGQRLQAEGGKKLQDMYHDGQDGYQKVKKDAKTEYSKAKKDASKAGDQMFDDAKDFGKKAEKEGKEAEEWAEKNKQNPVVIGNVVVVGALAALLGTGAYRMHRAGTLTYQVVGMWAGVVGLFAVGDYYVSQYLFRNKYPPK